MAWIAIATSSLIIAGCSVTPERETLPSAAWEGRTPQSAIETAFASLNMASTGDTGLAQVKPQGSCNELEVLFLNPRCSKMHKKRAWSRHHRVATFVVGRADTPPSTPTAPPESEALSEPLPTSDGIKANSAKARLRDALQITKPNENTETVDQSQYGLKSTCGRAWPYYDQACMLKRGSARVVRVIDLERHLRLSDGKRASP